MGFYSRVIFPRICNWVMNDPRMSRLRAEVLAEVSGEVLEIGFGTGLNLAHYPACVRKITTVDPNPGMSKLASRRIAASGLAVEHHLMSGESLPFAEHSFDCVVSTWTLCSIPDVSRAIDEIYRVLKPGGRFVFLEHGLSGHPKVARWQHRLNPLEAVLADGCRLDRDMAEIVGRAPFSELKVDRFEMEGMPRTHGTMYRGMATK